MSTAAVFEIWHEIEMSFSVHRLVQDECSSRARIQPALMSLMAGQTKVHATAVSSSDGLEPLA